MRKMTFVATREAKSSAPFVKSQRLAVIKIVFEDEACFIDREGKIIENAISDKNWKELTVDIKEDLSYLVESIYHNKIVVREER